MIVIKLIFSHLQSFKMIKKKEKVPKKFLVNKYKCFEEQSLGCKYQQDVFKKWYIIRIRKKKNKKYLWYYPCKDFFKLLYFWGSNQHYRHCFELAFEYLDIIIFTPLFPVSHFNIATVPRPTYFWIMSKQR